MKMQAHKPFISGFLLALFVAFYFNIAFFQHEHTVDGMSIAHSHIHKECHHNTASGGHTPEELIFIAKNSSFNTLEAILSTAISPLVAMVCDDVEVFLSEHPEVGFCTFFFLRGPPTA
ncbi:MAG: hypothetical protein LBH22_00265 [Bacteroidales bacterium]|jgi:hypothetical protein|nr:hypothetical protein [Bacteroidales bacterium]